jgi:UDP-N-acetylglucosamine--N-acetylmuramyl-(pentapeptide) pyrophosphoryl-undecaprenol N-acetylglucosamine transferase
MDDPSPTPVTAQRAGRTPGPLRVLLAGGGTAGHVEPALSVADALRRRDPAAEITALGTEQGLEARLIPERGYALRTIPRVPLPRGVTVDLLTLPRRLAGATSRTVEIIRETDPDVVVGFGGYVSLPAYFAARRCHRTIVVHEANARPGLANRIGARLTSYVATSSPDARLPHARLTGVPLRRSVATLDRATARGASRELFGLRPEGAALLVFGGSQGAQRINLAIREAAPELVARGIQVLHAAGANNPIEPIELPDGPPYVVVPYIDHMEQAYAAADLALCRSGAMTCAELSAVGLPAVFVPYPHSNGEQELNAQPLLRAGAGRLVGDDELTASRLLGEVLPLMLDSDRLRQMATAAASLGLRDADETMVDLVLEAVGRS